MLADALLVRHHSEIGDSRNFWDRPPVVTSVLIQGYDYRGLVLLCVYVFSILWWICINFWLTARWAYAMTWRPLAGTFRNRWSYWPETLYTWSTPFGKWILARSDYWRGNQWAGQNQKHKKCCGSNGWISSKFLSFIGTSNKDTWHSTHVFDLTYFWRSQVKVQNSTFSRHVSLLFDLDHSNLVWTCFYQISAQSDYKYGRQVAILENQQSYWPETLYIHTTR
jgi:hypothetical protein